MQIEVTKKIPPGTVQYVQYTLRVRIVTLLKINTPHHVHIILLLLIIICSSTLQN